MTVHDYLHKIKREKGAGYFLLLDPDRLRLADIVDLAVHAEESGVDAILVGSSILINSGFDELIKSVKNAAQIPVIIFPGSALQISRYADAILFLSLISGRNPDYLIGQQVRSAPIIKHIALETLSTGYMLINSGHYTSAEYMSTTHPIPRDKPDIAKATALAAQLLGMGYVYLEAGSGAKEPVPVKMIREVVNYVDIPVIVGGGIRKPEEARERVEAGASFIVTGNFFEEKGNHHLLREFSDAVHSARPS
ncbi:MAG: geranylgeranylglyceryl/heptaprenylglyceryl phosphate synthase [Deferribacteres bacterium]|nr:geranylgeranylglyceryl/heptaprenylglyceryl phosphate synthase [candidate division KSB1 bacterium]MCB9502964.1 geranylgeranylglyceryl/heptaprenylglyceryl phosphate synthase [Deferribacteres bacterium]